MLSGGERTWDPPLTSGAPLSEGEEKHGRFQVAGCSGRMLRLLGLTDLAQSNSPPHFTHFLPVAPQHTCECISSCVDRCSLRFCLWAQCNVHK